MASKFQIPIAFKSDPRGIKEAQGALEGFGKKLAGIGAAVAGAFAVRAVFNFGKEAILAAENVATANARLEAIAKATQVFGAETNKVTKSLIAFAEAQELVVAVDAEVIKGVQAQLLSFKQLSRSAGQVGGVFERVTMAAFDMAAAGFGTAESNAIALGKAFEDPIRGLTALRRSGTVFTQEQQDLIRTLVDSGDVLGAQTLILEELESQYGGTAEATANWSDRLNLAFDNIKESVGAALTPAFEAFAKYLIDDVIPPLTAFFEDDFPRIIEDMKPVIDDLKTFFGDVANGIRELLDIDADTSLIEGLLTKLTEIKDNPDFITFLGNMKTIFAEIGPLVAEAVFQIGELITKLVPLLKATLEKVLPLLGDMASILDDIGFFISEIVNQFGDWNVDSTGIIDFIERQINPMARLGAAVKFVADMLNDARVAYERWTGVQSAGANFRQGAGGAGRAVGGPVAANRTYMVGERGPEIFTPGAGGFITPNNRLGGGQTVNYNITVNAGLGSNGTQLGAEIVSLIKRYERSSGPVFASA